MTLVAHIDGALITDNMCVMAGVNSYVEKQETYTFKIGTADRLYRGAIAGNGSHLQAACYAVHQYISDYDEGHDIPLRPTIETLYCHGSSAIVWCGPVGSSPSRFVHAEFCEDHTIMSVIRPCDTVVLGSLKELAMPVIAKGKNRLKKRNRRFHSVNKRYDFMALGIRIADVLSPILHESGDIDIWTEGFLLKVPCDVVMYTGLGCEGTVLANQPEVVSSETGDFFVYPEPPDECDD